MATQGKYRVYIIDEVHIKTIPDVDGFARITSVARFSVGKRV
jgi:hypothetical protein